MLSRRKKLSGKRENIENGHVNGYWKLEYFGHQKDFVDGFYATQIQKKLATNNSNWKKDSLLLIFIIRFDSSSTSCQQNQEACSIVAGYFIVRVKMGDSQLLQHLVANVQATVFIEMD